MCKDMANIHFKLHSLWIPTYRKSWRLITGLSASHSFMFVGARPGRDLPVFMTVLDSSLAPPSVEFLLCDTHSLRSFP